MRVEITNESAWNMISEGKLIQLATYGIIISISGKSKKTKNKSMKHLRLWGKDYTKKTIHKQHYIKLKAFAS